MTTGLPSDGDDDLTTIRVDQFLPHPPRKVWRALTEPDLLVQWQMQGAETSAPGSVTGTG